MRARDRLVIAGRGDEGAGSVLVLGVAAVAVLLTALLVPLYMALSANRAVAAAADAAALAAADAASGALPGYPCELAALIAAENGARLTSCRLDGITATVAVEGAVFGLPVAAAARAGPPPDGDRHAGRSLGSD
ncbi:Rv3654c family TadE-like protein [Naasia sp. SYSU D00057]|uniref:Rv3654c family TadE-like protein n=1 Tax=Naasia sp. SYSU D00057 TaxID=2817380 RepID=UPI001B3108ED|nr:Rv3654c family TadE-like protein [Naasia sp. SYSU D00057]